MGKFEENDNRANRVQDHTSENVAKLRHISGMSRQDLLVRLLRDAGLDMHTTTLRRIENGDQQPKAIEAAAFARVFEIPLGDLISTPINPEASEINVRLADCANAMDMLHIHAALAIDAVADASNFLDGVIDPVIRQSKEAKALRDYIERSLPTIRAAARMRLGANLSDAEVAERLPWLGIPTSKDGEGQA